MSRHRHRFYVRQPLQIGARVILSREQSRQIANVLRLRPGDQIYVFNDDGSEYQAAIVGIQRGEVTTEIEDSQPGIEPPPFTIHLGLPIIKNDRFEWALQKATELGVARIIPINAEHSVISLPVDREERRRQRWLRIVVEAAEQCGRRDVPVIDPLTSLDDAVDSVDGAQVVIMWEDEDSAVLPTMDLDLTRPVRLIVGPEGGFAADEIELVKQAGALTASLGPFTLRSETAAVAAVSMLLARGIT